MKIRFKYKIFLSQIHRKIPKKTELYFIFFINFITINGKEKKNILTKNRSTAFAPILLEY